MNLAFADGDEREHNDPLLDESGKGAIQVLLLEDNEIDAVIFSKAASRCERTLNVERASSIAEFKERLSSVSPHLICADHVLPDGLALEAIAFTREVLPDTPFIVITGAGEEEVAAEYLRAGAADYLSKRRLDLFPKALEEVIERYRNRTLREIAESKALQLNDELQALIRHVEEERDEEKRSLSRDIHDQLGQELTALKLGLFFINGKLNGFSPSPELEALQEKINDLIELNTQTIKSVRNLAHSLRPVVLDQVGLTAGLESLVRDFNKRNQGFCGLHCSDLPDLSNNMRTDIFRIVQETLTNIARHAEASISYIQLGPLKDGLQLEVVDNGKGMDLSNEISRPEQGLGLVGMRERARNHNGRINIDSAPGRGTTISIFFPEVPTS